MVAAEFFITISLNKARERHKQEAHFLLVELQKEARMFCLVPQNYKNTFAACFVGWVGEMGEG